MKKAIVILSAVILAIVVITSNVSAQTGWYIGDTQIGYHATHSGEVTGCFFWGTVFSLDIQTETTAWWTSTLMSDESTNKFEMGIMAVKEPQGNGDVQFYASWSNNGQGGMDGPYTLGASYIDQTFGMGFGWVPDENGNHIMGAYVREYWETEWRLLCTVTFNTEWTATLLSDALEVDAPISATGWISIASDLEYQREHNLWYLHGITANGYHTYRNDPEDYNIMVPSEGYGNGYFYTHTISGSRGQEQNFNQLMSFSRSTPPPLALGKSVPIAKYQLSTIELPASFLATHPQFKK